MQNAFEFINGLWLYLIDGVPEITTELAINYEALHRNRLRQSGKDSQGKLISTKSDNADGVYSESYKIKREKAGRQTNYVDFTFNNELFGDLGIEKQEGQGKKKKVVYKPLDKISRPNNIISSEIIKSLNENFGIDFFEATKEEKEILLDIAKDWAKNRVKEYIDKI